MKHVDTSCFLLLKTQLQMNSNSLVIKQKQNQTNKQKKNKQVKIEFQNSIIRLRFLTHIKIAWINP